ncbi:MAG: hypothetical protein RBQ77_01615 [Candidatus Methanomethylophilaceae archaeon]|jgi:hypothetical protein|nr:hypothetical protein [Candidatus Methanomethylophilaceae archaeon]NLF33467.1 hypothetical protein [Thermoplasmatales archaeon]
MAKKKKRTSDEPKEEYEFVATKFDEKEFILRDIYGTKVLLVVVLMSVVLSVVCALLWSADLWYVGVILMILLTAGMKPLLLRMKFRVDMLETKTMLGNYALFLLLTLGLWILFINPPFV